MRILVKPLVFAVLALPALHMFYAVFLAFTGGENLLGPDPAKTLALLTGEWSIRILLVSLAMTPLRYLINWSYAWQLRRMTGLFAFFYASLHLLVFIMFLLGWEWSELATEVIERPYITLGFAAYVLMLPLALTSFNLAQRRLGRNWKKLHRAVYLVSLLAVLHVVWIVRSSYGDAVLYGGITGLLLGYRLFRHYSPSVRSFTLAALFRRG